VSRRSAQTWLPVTYNSVTLVIYALAFCFTFIIKFSIVYTYTFGLPVHTNEIVSLNMFITQISSPLYNKLLWTSLWNVINRSGRFHDITGTSYIVGYINIILKWLRSKCIAFI